MIYDYGSVRFEIGTACALMLLTLLLYAAVVAAGHLLVWAVSRLFRACGAPRGSMGILYGRCIAGNRGFGVRCAAAVPGIYPD